MCEGDIAVLREAAMSKIQEWEGGRDRGRVGVT